MRTPVIRDKVIWHCLLFDSTIAWLSAKFMLFFWFAHFNALQCSLEIQEDHFRSKLFPFNWTNNDNCHHSMMIIIDEIFPIFRMRHAIVLCMDRLQVVENGVWVTAMFNWGILTIDHRASTEWPVSSVKCTFYFNDARNSLKLWNES